ncbi:PRD domain-containing protein [Virgibacillus sp. NKC19-3]|uniref:BglG family transcription antiterminator LicT n=1 Tax=Virgibacillus saliphilus TaxID=2831674 RepID=UPI001C9AEFAD|nr:PRD domain-containing protein [Virgibacillus sp. NKC19-3]MBY7142261.1 PRD domain-containing protein [Virgibacillus sp. NKC19-3]
MKIKKILNNNVAISHNELNQEIIVMGRGLAFQKKEGAFIDPSKIEKTFILESKGISNKIAELLQDIPEIYLELAHKIIALAKEKLSYKLDDYLYVALIDHLNFAVERHERGLDLKNALLWEVRKYYKQEFQISLEALDIINKELDINLPEDEAASIALHFVNSQISGENMAEAIQVTEMVNDILNIVKYYYQMDLDEDSINYERFLTHLRFFAMRFVRKEKTANSYDEFLYDQIKSKYNKAFRCAERIAAYIENDYDWTISHDELLYLTLHIYRLTSRD